LFDCYVCFTGKTNNGVHLFGRAMRHLDVLMCPIGAMALYLYFRFKLSQEFCNPPDFTVNQSWYDVKLYTDGSIKRQKSGIASKGYGDAMAAVAAGLNISCMHTTHLGRVLGPKVLEMLEFDQDEIRILGNWNPKTQESTYSAKVPMKALRGMAGFGKGVGGVHYNPRSVVPVPVELSNAVFPWLEESIDSLDSYEARGGESKPTARQFLNHMSVLSTVLIQDVAAMKCLHPERIDPQLPLFKNDAIFNSDAFHVSFSLVPILLSCLHN
jgi:Centromere DNA-binding protein complex CBF3 subunit, domain 2